jgi:spore coat protein U-like protein
VSAGITVSSTVNGQARVSVGSTVAAGTYNETLTVTDGLGATGRMNFTIRVNAPVALTGTQTVNATYGEAFTTGFNSSGGTGPFVFSASNI